MIAKRTHIAHYETTIDNIAEHETIKQMLTAYGDGKFGRGTGPNFKELEAQKLARKERVSSQIIANNNDSVNDDIDNGDGWSPPQIRERFFDKTKKKKAKKHPRVNKWKNSDRESSSSNSETMQHFHSGPILENEELKNEEKKQKPR